MAVAHDFSKMVPGFDFLQGLVKNASSALPSLGQWVAPTLDPQELGKRIEELKTVQFWLEQNARMIATTVQALEVQRMTLSTLKTMNVQVADLAQAFKLNDPVPPAPAAQPAQAPEAAKSASRASRPSGSASSASSAGHSAAASSPAQAAAGASPGVVDPMQWWGALTQQFTQLAAQAMKDGSAEAAGQLAGAMVKSSAEAVGQAMQQAGLPTAGGAAAPGKSARKAAGAPAPSDGSAASASASTGRPARKAARAPTRRTAKRSA
jgi:hypothetical protein